ncbi:MAG: hypothetical protein RTU30_07810 [Candidatus Thorarchaeota archaeon]
MKRAYSIILLGLLLGSAIGMTGLASAQVPAPGDPYVRVLWDTKNETRAWEHEDENSQWVFGPQPAIWIGDADTLVSIEENNYEVEVNQKLLLNITVPKSFLGEGNELDSIHFWGTTWRPRSPIFAFEYNATSEHWASASYHYQPGLEAPTQSDFMELYTNECVYNEDTDFYSAVFVFEFIEDVITAVFWTGMQAVDTMGRPVQPSWLNRLDGGFESPPVGLGISVDPRDFSLPSYYHADIVDTNGDLLHYVDDNETFIVRLMAGVELGEVQMPFAFLTWDSQYQMNVTWEQPLGWPASMYNLEAPKVPMSAMLAPTLFVVHNSSGSFWEVGYPTIDFVEYPLTDDVSAWVLDYGIEVNHTLPLSDYFVEDRNYTGEFNDGNAARWAGYFTNKTDMDSDPFVLGDVLPIAVEDNWILAVVKDTEGTPINPRPEIFHRQTLRLSYKDDFIEAFVKDDLGDVVEIGEQGEELTLEMVIHRPGDFVNGSYELIDVDKWGNDFQINHTLKNFTLSVWGMGSHQNDTHWWNFATIYVLVIDFELEDWITTTIVAKETFDITTGTQVEYWERTTDWMIVNGYAIDVGETETTLGINVTFSLDAPSMILDRSVARVGLIQNIRIWNSTAWDYPWWIPGFDPAIWTDVFIEKDLSQDIVWSPSHFRLGHIIRWVPPIWTVTEDGALDLDGNTYTTEDQYYIKRTGYWHDWGNTTVEGMNVVVAFDPAPNEAGDEFVSVNWMGVVTMVMEFEATETFYWYHTDMSPVSNAELDEIRDLMWADQAEDLPAPEYQYVAWLSVNRTLELSGITGLDENVWTNTWFAWGTQQAFQVAVTESQRTWATFRAQYAGLLIFDDLGGDDANQAPDFSINEGQVVTDEVSHVVLIDSIDRVELRRPFNSNETSGDVFVDPSTVVEFGISIHDVEVSIYPLRIENSDGIRGPWHFRESYEGALGLNSTSFDYWITHATVEEMAFDITFTVDMVQYDALDEETWNHAVSFKIDQVFGDWTLDEFDNSVLDEKALAVNFFGVLATGTRTQYTAETAPVTDTNSDSLTADYYQFGAANSPFANVSMGDLPYTYGGDDHTETFYSGSSSVPIGAFSLMYESDSGSTVTNWNVEASMLFMTAGYTQWGGHDIICDPVFIAYTSSHNSAGGPTVTPTTTTPTTGTTPTTSTPTTTTTTTPTIGGDLSTYVLVFGGVIVLVIVLVLVRRRQ